MPLAALIGAAGQIVGGQMNNAAVQNANAESRVFSAQMYEKQRADAIEFWNMQNAYNSPAAQMQRFKDAGLNPNLVYSQGNPGNSGAISSPTVMRPEFNAGRPGDGVAGAAMSYMNALYDLDIKAAQADNLKAQNTIYRQQALLQMADLAGKEISNKRGEFDFGQSQAVAPYNIQYLQERNRQMKVSTDLAINKDMREAVANASNVKEAAERILSMQVGRGLTRLQYEQTRAVIDNLHKDGILKQLDIDLKKDGIQPHDPMYARIIARLLNGTSDLLQPLEMLPKADISFRPRGEKY